MDSSCLFISGRRVPPRAGKAWFPGVPTPLVRDFVAPEEQSPKYNFEQLFSHCCARCARCALVNARCLTADDRTPLVALTNHLLIGATEREFEIQKVEPFDGREALHTRLGAKWDGVAMKMDVWVLSKDGCVYDFVYLAPPETFSGGTPEFERFVRGFRTLRGSGVA